ncbi:AMP-binding protein [Alphaproteobacteria bacterium]|nr:AMP-binding protein [Alphaproteobacteria bacterium]
MPNSIGDSWRLDRAILAHADTQPDRIALTFDNVQISYGDLRDQVETAAAFLASHLDAGDRFAIYSMNHPNVFVLLLAAARIRAVMVPLNWRLSVAEIAYQLDDCRPKILFYGDDFAENILELTAKSSVIATAKANEALFPIEALGALAADNNTGDRTGNLTGDGTGHEDAIDAPLLVVYTSGTTGRPKGAVLPQRAMRSNAIMSTHAFDLAKSDITLNILPLFHVGGLNIQPIPTLIAGGQIVIHKTFNPAEVIAAIASDKITQVTTVPTMLAALLAHDDWARADLSSLRMMAIGSTDVPATMINQIQADGIALVQVYGATETAPTAIYQTADIAFDSVGSIGRAGIDCAIRLVDENGQDVALGMVGEIWVKGDNILSHYWNNPEQSTASISDGWFHTGDMARLDTNGLYWFADRLKHVIISGGENIYPAELERVLNNHPRLVEFTIIGRDDERWGQVPVVVAVRRDQSIDAAAIISVFDDEVAKFKRPKDVIFVDALPRNALGKIVTDQVAALIAGS